MKYDDGLPLTSNTFQSQIFNIRLTTTERRQTLFDGGFELANHVEVKNVGYDRIIRGTMLHFKPSTLIWRSAENSQVSLKQFKKRQSTDFDQTQGFIILTNIGEPKLTVGTIMILQVFHSRMTRHQVDIQLVIESLTRILNKHAKVNDIVLISIPLNIGFIDIGSFDWTWNGNPSGRIICLHAAHV